MREGPQSLILADIFQGCLKIVSQVRLSLKMASLASSALIQELRLLAESIGGMIERARSSRPSYTADEFINADRLKERTGLYQLYPVQEYVRCFRALGVKNREELGELCKRRYAEAPVRDAAEEFLQSEEEFGEFVSLVDGEVKAAENARAVENVLDVGSSVPTELSLLDADSDRLVSLGTVLDEAPFTLFVFKRHYL